MGSKDISLLILDIQVTWKQLSAMLVKSWTDGWLSCSSCLAAIIMQATAVSCKWLRGTACTRRCSLDLKCSFGAKVRME